MIFSLIAWSSLLALKLLRFSNKLTASTPSVKSRLEATTNYAPTGKTPSEALVQIAKLDVVMNASKTAAILKEAFENYMGWEVYEHI